MRIIAGQHRGVRLGALGKGDAGAHLRPTPDRVRESLFNVLNAWIDWDGLAVLDLFAGTGALGLEALSRGAEHVTFVENGRVGKKLILENIAKLRCGDRTELIASDATRLSSATTTFDLVFLDPPYGKGLGPYALSSLKDGRWLADNALIVWEENAPQDAPLGFSVVENRKYGETYLTFLEPNV